MSALPLPGERFRRSGRRRQLRHSNHPLPRLPGIVRRLHAYSQKKFRLENRSEAAKKISRTHFHSADDARATGLSGISRPAAPARSAAGDLLGKNAMGLPGFQTASHRTVEQSGPLPALRKFSGEKRL